MTAPPSGGTTKPAKVAAPRKPELKAVRTRDIQQLRTFGPPLGAQLPALHGADEDPRYPSPYALRTWIGFMIDLAIHVGGAVAVGITLGRMPELSQYSFVAALGTFFGLSILHRVLLQWLFQTTLGKSLVGLRMICEDTGRRPTLWQLAKAWVVNLFRTVLGVLSIG